MKELNGFDPTSTNEFGVGLSIEERQGGVIALVLNGGEFKDAEVLITAGQAKDVGEVLVRYGIHALSGVDVVPGTAVSDMIRQKLATRVALVAKNLTDRKKTPEFIAQEVVDIVLREVM